MYHILFVLQDQEDQQDQTVSLSIYTYLTVQANKDKLKFIYSS